MEGKAYVVITTSRKRRGELSGQLKINTLATIGKYLLGWESLLATMIDSFRTNKSILFKRNVS